MVMLSAQGMGVAKIAEVTFTSADRVRDVIHNFNRPAAAGDGVRVLGPSAGWARWTSWEALTNGKRPGRRPRRPATWQIGRAHV